MSKKLTISILLVLAIISGIGIAFLPVIPQDLAYHKFVDTKAMLGIPNTLNVLSNLPFCIVGIIGFFAPRNIHSPLRLHYAIFFIGIFLVGLGSGYYHLSPDNNTLVWDRLPMAIGFASLFCAIIYEKIDESVGKYALPFLLIFGIGSVFYWQYADDLRPYIITQFFPILVIPFILWVRKSDNNSYLWKMILWYLFAKVLEYGDNYLYNITSQLISGHTLKHIAASIAVYHVVRYVRRIKYE